MPTGFDTTGLSHGLLFDQDERKKLTDLDTTTDQIRERFGSWALRKAASIPHQEEPRRE